ncbi:ferredoxin [Streptomyces sp. NBC_01465]|uniref:ferredoxin n=1 Tax=Streptomyces sp. NBC_01465 TaxID=2903878 RepID=UPI002E33C726|nr:ferredoxin [Streptomyces sp. NBC_01465]
MSRTHIEIDWTSCTGHRLCVEQLPDHITSDEWGYPLIVDTLVNTRAARRAEADCPVLALRLTASPRTPAAVPRP